MNLLRRIRSAVPPRLWLVILLGLILRIAFFVAGDPLTWPDSPAYIDLAKMILSGDFSNHLGARTPGYPLLILLMGFQSRLVVAAQMMLGLATAGLTYGLCRELTGNAVLATVAGMLYNLNAVVLVHEMSILTEALTTFTVTLSVFLWVKAVKQLREGRRFTSFLLASGIASGYSGIVRPDMAFLPFVLFLFGLVLVWRHARSQWWVVVSSLLPAVILIGGWVMFNYLHLGVFSLSTALGFSLPDLVAPFLDFAPDDYGLIRDILLSYRPSAIEQWGIPVGIQFAAMKEIMKITGWNYIQLSQAYLQLSLSLIKVAPHYFIRVFLVSWDLYWHTSMIPGVETFLPNVPALHDWISSCWRILQQVYDFLTDFYFLLLPGTTIYGLAKGLRAMREQIFLWLVLAAISLTSALAHTMLTMGNYRYHLYTLPLNLGLILSMIQYIGRGIGCKFWKSYNNSRRAGFEPSF